MKLEIDLNKLNIDELKTVIKLAEKQEEPQEEPQPQKKEVVDVAKPKHKLGQKYTKEMVETLKEAYLDSKTRKKLSKNVARWCRKYGVKKINALASASKFGFVGLRKKTIQSTKEYKGMIRKKPFLPQDTIQQGWNAGDIKQMEFPQIKNVTGGFSTILQGIVNNVFTKSGLKMTFNCEGVAIGIIFPKDWNDFCEDFILKSSMIAQYFNVANKFKLNYTGKLPVISYAK